MPEKVVEKRAISPDGAVGFSQYIARNERICMSIIKLAAYALLGYVLYELYLGISQGVEAKKAEAIAAPAASAKPSRGNLRGSKSVSVAGQSGASSKRSVGRGVI